MENPNEIGGNKTINDAGSEWDSIVGEGERPLSNEEIAKEFANEIIDKDVEELIKEEFSQFNTLYVKTHEKFNGGKRNIVDKFIIELHYANNAAEMKRRYGFSAESEEALQKAHDYYEKEMINGGWAGRKAYAQKRAYDWKMVDLALNGENKDEITGQLKRGGFKDLPEKWDDDHFTTYEVHKMAEIAKKASGEK